MKKPTKEQIAKVNAALENHGWRRVTDEAPEPKTISVPVKVIEQPPREPRTITVQVTEVT